MKYYIGIDLGGTNVRVAKMDEDGNIVQDVIKPSHGLEGPRELIRDTIFSCLDEIKDLDKCEGIGIGAPGPIDTKRKLMSVSSNLVGFKEYPIADMIEEKYKLPCFIDNDANVAGLAEALVGSGKGYPIVYYLTHSTGIGGALIINGKVVSGRLGFAGEVGNIIIDRNYPKINHLNAGASECLASGTAIGRRAREIFKDEKMGASDVFRLAKEGNTDAVKLVDDVTRDFAQLLSSISHIVDPHCFVIGGGVSKASDYYFPILKKYYNSMVHEGMRDVPILKTTLKEPGVLGAALLAKTNLE